LNTVARKAAKAFVVLFALMVPLFIAATPASGAIVINEVESQPPSGEDYIELLNTGPAPVDISGYLLTDSDPSHVYVLPDETVLPPFGYFLPDFTAYFSLGIADDANLYGPGGNPLLDHYNWAAHAAGTYSRCPNGTGPFIDVPTATPGASNSCPVADADGDAVPDSTDNCVNTANPTQANRDGDAAGDACDTDDDGDGVPDASDGCPTGGTGSGGDTDGDGCKSAEDADDDGDKVADVNDNCQALANADQADGDGDGIGNVCDPVDDVACNAAKAKLKRAKAKLRKAKKSEDRERIKKAKKKVKKARRLVAEAC